MWVAIAYAVVSAVSKVSQGMQQKQQADAMAANYEQQAQAITNQGIYEKKMKEAANAKMTATQQAELINSGAELNDSSLDWLVDQSGQMQLDANMIKYNADVKANSYTNQAAITRASGKAAQQQGYMGALTSVLGTAVMAYSGGMFNSTPAAATQASTQSLTQAGNFYNPTTGTITMTSPNYAGIPSAGDLY